MKSKGYPIKDNFWKPFHWKVWDKLTPKQRLDYEQKIEDKDNQKVMSRIRGVWNSRNRSANKNQAH